MCRCDPLFADFIWEDLVTLNPKELPTGIGVYAIRIRKRGDSIESVIHRTHELLQNLNWSAFGDHVLHACHKSFTPDPLLSHPVWDNAHTYF